MKRLFAATLSLTLLLTGCTAPATPQPTLTPTVTTAPTATPIPTPTLSPEELGAQMAEDYVNGTINYPNDLTAEQKTAFERALAEVESSLTYEQQKTMIENRFEAGSTAFEAVIKADGNLEYYDGSWKTLEAMRNLNGEIIPWGESYDMNSEEGRNGILTNIMAGNEAAMNEHSRIFDIYKTSAEKKGFDLSNFNMLYVQFFPDVESLVRKRPSEKIGYYSMEGLMVMKNGNGKTFVIKIETSMNLGTIITGVKTATTIKYNDLQLFTHKYYKNAFYSISSADYLNYRFKGLKSVLDEPADLAWMEKVLNFNMENILKKLETNPNSISEDLYDPLSAIYFD